MKTALSAALLPLFAGESHLLGQCVKVDQDELGQVVGLSRFFLTDAFLFVNSVVAYQSQTMRPLFQGFGQLPLGSQVFDSFEQRLASVIRSLIFGGQFKGTPIHCSRRIPMLSMQRFLGLNKSPRDALRHMLRRFQWNWLGKNPLNKNASQLLQVTMALARKHISSHETHPYCNWPQTGIATKHQVPFLHDTRVMGVTNQREAYSRRTAMRAIVSKGDSHVYS